MYSVMEEKNLAAVAQQPGNAVSVVDFSKLPNLNEAQVDPVELSGEYWTPETEGESKRVFFAGLVEESVLEMESGETRQLIVAKFVEQRNGQLRAVRNGSRRLVGIFEQFANTVKIGDAFEITYLGKKKNSTNSFKSDNWSVKSLTFKK